MKYRNYYCTPRYSDKEQMYFGVVEGAPKIPTIEAETVDDFERLFHEAVDDYLERRQDAKRRAKWGVFIHLIAVVGILVAAVLTCPKKEQHVSVLTERLSYLFSDSAGAENDANILKAMLGSAIAKPLINTYLVVDDHILFSVGHLEYQGDDRVVSVGAFGHIFTMSREELKRRTEQSKESQEFLDQFK